MKSCWPGSHARCHLYGGTARRDRKSWRALDSACARRLRALAVASERRVAALPEVPTFAEAGLPLVNDPSWFGLVAPAKTPKGTVAQRIDWCRSALLAPDIKAKLVAQALYPNPICGADFDAHLQRQFDLYARLISELNIKTQ